MFCAKIRGGRAASIATRGKRFVARQQESLFIFPEHPARNKFRAQPACADARNARKSSVLAARIIRGGRMKIPPPARSPLARTSELLLDEKKERWNPATFPRLCPGLPGLSWPKVPLTLRFFPPFSRKLARSNSRSRSQRASLNGPTTFVYFLKGAVNGSLAQTCNPDNQQAYSCRGNCKSVFHPRKG